MGRVDESFERAMIELADRGDLTIERYQRVDLHIYDQDILNRLIKDCKYKDIGNVYDYKDILPQPTVIREYDIPSNYKLFQRLNYLLNYFLKNIDFKN